MHSNANGIAGVKNKVSVLTAATSGALPVAQLACQLTTGYGDREFDSCRWHSDMRWAANAPGAGHLLPNVSI